MSRFCLEVLFILATAVQINMTSFGDFALLRNMIV